jgi:protein-arginine kinase activator protein McsA
MHAQKRQTAESFRQENSKKEKEMSKAVKELDFETAAILRDEIGVLRNRVEIEE